MGTAEFADAVIGRPGQIPTTLAAAQVKSTDGVEVFLHHRDRDPAALSAALNIAAEGTWLSLQMITNRGLKVWPGGMPETFCTDHWRARCQSPQSSSTPRSHVIQLLHRLDRAELDFIKTEGYTGLTMTGLLPLNLVEAAHTERHARAGAKLRARLRLPLDDRGVDGRGQVSTALSVRSGPPFETQFAMLKVGDIQSDEFDRSVRVLSRHSIARAAECGRLFSSEVQRRTLLVGGGSFLMD